MSEQAVHKGMLLKQLFNLVVVRSIDQRLGIEGVVHIGAKELNPTFVYHLVGFALRTIAIEANKREYVDLEINTHVFKTLEFGRR